MTHHWAYVRMLPDVESEIAAFENEQTTKPRSLEVEGHSVHQPSYFHRPTSYELFGSREFSVSDLTISTINLLHSCNRSQVSWTSTSDSMVVGSCKSADKGKSGIYFIPRDLESSFVNGIAKPLTEIDLDVCKRLLGRSVAAILAHTGFDGCHEICLDKLNDVIPFFLKQFVAFFRTSMDNQSEITSGQSHITAPFMEFGMGNVMTLHNFFQTQLVLYKSHLIQLQKLRQKEMGDMSLSSTTSAQLIDSNMSAPGYRMEQAGMDIHFPTDELEEPLSNRMTPSLYGTDPCAE